VLSGLGGGASSNKLNRFGRQFWALAFQVVDGTFCDFNTQSDQHTLARKPAASTWPPATSPPRPYALEERPRPDRPVEREFCERSISPKP